MKILLLESNEDVREILGVMLGRMGHEIVAPGSVTDALKAVEFGALEFEVLIVEERYPEISGVELTVAAKWRNENLRCVLVTADSRTETVRHLSKYGNVLLKPFGVEDLRSVLL
ncbi:response regulator [Candidatus Giovannonibacteria bacterium]|nr:response regulator [Candidatus Giovannonibacteria bacterium]